MSISALRGPSRSWRTRFSLLLLLALAATGPSAGALAAVAVTPNAARVLAGTAMLQASAPSGSPLDYTPASIDRTVSLGDAVTTTVTLSNAGPVPIDFRVRIGGYVVPEANAASLPAWVAPVGRDGSGATLEAIAAASPPRAGWIAPAGDTDTVLVEQLPDADNGIFADRLCTRCSSGTQSVAENVTLSADEIIGRIVVWGGYFDGNVPFAPDRFSVRVHADAGGVPGAVLFEQDAVPSEREATGGQLFGVDEWQFTLTLDGGVALPAGHYWIELWNEDAASGEDFFWETGSQDPLHGLTGHAVATDATPGGDWRFEAASLALRLIRGAPGGGWASATPAAGTIPANGTATFEVRFDASGIERLGTYSATLGLEGSFAGAPVSLPLTMRVDCPSCGTLVGAVGDAASQAPVEAAIEVAGGNLRYRSSGSDFAFELPAGRYTLTAAAPDYYTRTVETVVTAGTQTRTDLALTRITSVLSYTPSAIGESMQLGEIRRNTVTVSNDGNQAFDFRVHVGRFALPALVPAVSPLEQAAYTPAASIGPASARSPASAAIEATAGGAGWAQATPLPAGLVRYGAAQCADDPEGFYVIGGVENGVLVDHVRRYDVVQAQWTALAPVPDPQEGGSSVCHRGYLYHLAGGGSNAFHIYDIAADRWQAGPALPRGVWGAAIAAYDGRVVVAGGAADFGFGQPSDAVDIFDIASGSWRSGARLPVAVTAAGYAQTGSFLYLAGGWGADAPAANAAVTQRYDLAADTWELGPAFTPARADFALAATATHLYAIGGDADGGGGFDASPAVDALDHETWPAGNWQADPATLATGLSALRAGLCTETLTGGEIWAVGGLDAARVAQPSNQYRSGERCYAGEDRWAYVTDGGGTVAPGATAQFDVVFDATGLSQSGLYQAELMFSGTYLNAPAAMPLSMQLGCSGCAVLSGAITDQADGTPLEANIQVSGGGFSIRVRGDHYAVDVPPGSYRVEVSAAGYFAGATSLTVAAGQTAIGDVALVRQFADLVFTPAAIVESLEFGQTATHTVTVSNPGTIDATFDLRIGRWTGPGAGRPAPVSIPRYTGEVPRLHAQTLAGAAPPASSTAESGEPELDLAAFPGSSAIAIQLGWRKYLVAFDDVSVPGTATTIAPIWDEYYAGDYVGGDYGKLYVLEAAVNELQTLDVATGQVDPVGPAVGFGNWSGLSSAPDGTVYAVSSNCLANSTLYRIDPASAALTELGRTTIATCVVDIAVAPDGTLYALDIATDSLYVWDPVRGDVRWIGSLGVDANFGQSIAFDYESGTLYWAAYTTEGQMRVIDPATGASALVGRLPGGAQHDALAFRNPVTAPWASASQSHFVLPPGGQAAFEVRIDPAALLDPGHYTAQLYFAGDYASAVPALPLTLDLSCGSCATVSGAITDSADGSPVEADIVIDAGAYHRRISGSGYAVSAPAGRYTIRVQAPGHFAQTRSVDLAAGAATVADFALVRQQALLDVDTDAIETTQAIGETRRTTIHLANTGNHPFTYSARFGGYGGPDLTAGGVPGHGEWLHRGEAQRDAGNSGVAHERVPSAYRWAPHDAVQGARRVLVYADDFVHFAPQTLVDQALQALGWEYTAYYGGDFSGFVDALTGQSWDLVLFDNEDAFIEDTVIAALEAYVDGGGKLVLNAFGVDTFSPLWPKLGIAGFEEIYEGPAPVYWWEAGHAAFTSPEQVPPLADVDPVPYSVFGQRVSVAEGYTPIAGFTSAAAPGQAALIVGNDGRTVFKAFSDGPYSADADGDGLIDGAELWANLAAGVSDGFGPGGWASASPPSATLAPGAQLAVDVSFDAAGLDTPGTYTGSLRFGGDFHNAPGSVALTMHVTGAAAGDPLIAADPDALVLDAAQGSIASDVLGIANVGGGTLAWSIDTAAARAPDLRKAAIERTAPLTVRASALWPAAVPPAGSGSPGGEACGGAAVAVVHEDGSVEDGYGAHPQRAGRLRLVDRFTPASYPARVESACVAFVAGPGQAAPLAFELVVYDDDGPGGSPGTRLGAVPVLADRLGIHPDPAPAWIGVDVSALQLTVSSGSVYIGVEYLAPGAPVLVAADQSAAQPAGVGGGYIWTDTGADWVSSADLWPAYRALMLRAVLPGAGNPEPPTCANPGTVPWLGLSRSAGYTAAGATSPVTVTADASALTPGVYTTLLCVDSNDSAGNTHLELPVELTVQAGGGVFPAPYCAVAFPSGVEPITRVAIAGIDQRSDAAVGASPALEDFLHVQGDLLPGEVYRLIVEGNTDGRYRAEVRAFFDWNRDGRFTGADESYPIGTLFDSTGEDGIQAAADVRVPDGVAAGPTRMRVIKRYNTDPADPCTIGGYGQAEDYTVRVGSSGAVQADLDLGVTTTPATATAGATLGFRIRVGNAGPQAAAGVAVDLQLPPGLSFVTGRWVDGVPRGGADWQCAATGQRVTCALTGGSLPVDAQAAWLDVETAVAADAAGLLSTELTVSAATPDPNPANDRVVLVTRVLADGDCLFGDGFEAGGSGQCGR